ncbi:MAG: putative chromosome-partitioning protein ParB [Wolbachia endosymbiont of Ctenocephalides orientis wCori]|nr:MAG: putative chromosome-partitioning protein ParB [Wolbachia endosymbiont of Ctenocephalides orientis wCori]
MIEDRRLGRGLAGLIGDSYAGNSGEKNEQENLPISLLHPGKFQPRKYFDEESLNELADSIKRNGIIQPIVVREDPNNRGYYEIIAGERRWRASKIAELEEVPVVIKDLSDKACLEIAIIENIQRQDISPIEEGEAYQRLKDEFFYTYKELGSVIGKSESYITNMTRILALSENIKTMVNQKKLSVGHARALINIENAESIAEKVVLQKLNVRQTEELIKRQKTDDRQKDHKDQKNQDTRLLERAISIRLGLKVKINDQNSKGKVTIQYSNLEEFNLILKNLGEKTENSVVQIRSLI